MAIADFGLGVQGGLQQLLARRMMEQKAIEQARQAEFEQQTRVRQLEQGDRRLEMDAEELDLRKNATAPPERPFQIGGRIVTPSGQVVYEAPPEAPAPEKPVVVGGRLVMPSTGSVVYEPPREPSAPTNEPLVAVVGPDGRPVLVPRRDAVGKQPASNRETATRPSLGTERKAMGFFNRMLEAERNARAVENKIGNRDTLVSDLPLVPDWLENFIRTPEGQRYVQAQRTFTEARLRKESGAAVPKEEYESDRTTNFRVSNDKPETLAQKRAARLRTMRGIATEAGRALNEEYGDEATIDSLLAEFAEKAAAPTATVDTEFDFVPGKGLVPRGQK